MRYVPSMSIIQLINHSLAYENYRNTFIVYFKLQIGKVRASYDSQRADGDIWSRS